MSFEAHRSISMSALAALEARVRRRGVAVCACFAVGTLVAATLAGCQRDAPTELGADAAATQSQPSPAVAPQAAPAPAPSRITPAAAAAAAQITGEDIRRVVAEIADDRYAGRAPGSPGDKLTRAFLVRELEALGFEPGAADGTWEQPVELIGVAAAAPGDAAVARA